MLKFQYDNGNPWGEDIPDCAIRNLCIAYNMSYAKLCKMFNEKYNIGVGLVSDRGIDVDKIIEVCQKHGMIDNYELDDIFDDALENDDVIIDDENDFYDTNDSLIDIEMGMTPNEFSEIYPARKFILFLRPTTKQRKIGDRDWHTTYLDNGRKAIVDSLDCRRGCYVFGWMQVKESSILSDDDPDSRATELRKIASKPEFVPIKSDGYPVWWKGNKPRAKEH